MKSFVTSAVTKIVMIYAAFAALWILLSDSLASFFFSDPQQLAIVSIVKGLLFVLTTSVLLAVLVHRHLNVLAKKNNELHESAEHLALMSFAINHVREAAYLISEDSSLVYVNDEACRALGYQREELLNMGVFDIEAEFPQQEWSNHWQQLKQNRSATFESTHRTKDQRLFPVEITANYFEFESEGYNLALARDITERRVAEDKLRLASLVYQHSSEAMIVCDANNNIIAINPAFTQMTGYTADDVLGKNPSILSSNRQDQAFYSAMWDHLSSHSQWQGELWNRRKDGHEYLEWLSINTIYNSDSKIHGYVALFSDITEKKESEDLIWQQANFDALTNLPNRRMFCERIEHEIKKSKREGLPLAVLFIDLDRFKEVNDTLGHAMGDMLLVEAARRILECVRESDTVARLGGDEFTLILSGLDDISSVERIAQIILLTMTQPFRLGEDLAYVSASIGITLYPDDATEVDELLKHADQAMYVAKDKGRNRYQFFTASMQQAAQARMRLTGDLRNALAEHQFSLHYQPIVEMATGHINKAEALIRWQHPTQGLISPADFIPIAEDTGMIIEIGDWVFHEAAQQVAQWRELYQPTFKVSINKSPVQFHSTLNNHQPWVDYLYKLGLPGQSIVVEITEGLLLDAGSTVNEQLLEFRDAGIQIAIDDFGTGYSSLSYLKKFEIDYLKIDQSFVRNLAPGSSDQALCEAIIAMAHKLNMKVIAEGVETQEQFEILLAAGCDFGQGYLFSKPVPADEFERLFAQPSSLGFTPPDPALI